jgi:hypothetical protein
MGTYCLLLRTTRTDRYLLVNPTVDSAHPSFRKISALVKETKESTRDAMAKLAGGKL